MNSSEAESDNSDDYKPEGKKICNLSSHKGNVIIN